MKKLINLFGLVCLLAVTSLYAQAESMKLNVSESVIVNETPAKLWELLGDYNSLDKWHPAIIKSELQGSGKNKGDIRVLTLGDGGLVYDELIGYSQEKKAYTYKVNEAPLPVTNYIGTLMVEHFESGRSRVTWECDFVANGVSDKEAIEVISGIYKSGLESLAERY